MKKKGLSIKQMRKKRKESVAERRRKSILRKQIRSRLLLHKRNDQLLTSEFRQKLRVQKLEDIRDQVAYSLKPALLITTLKRKINKATCEAINIEVQNTLHFVHTSVPMSSDEKDSDKERESQSQPKVGAYFAEITDELKDPKLLRQLVRRELISGATREAAFTDILLDQSFLAPQDVSSYWFSVLDKDEDVVPNSDDIDPHHFNLLKIIHEESKKTKRAAATRVCSSWKCKLRLLSDRYAIDVKEVDEKFDRLVLYDLLHWDKRELELEGQKPEKLHTTIYKLEVLDPQYILYINKLEGEEIHPLIHTAHLIKLDSQNWTYRFVDSLNFKGYYTDLKVLYFRMPEFIFYIEDRDLSRLYFGQVKEDKFEVDKERFINRLWNSHSGMTVKNNKIIILQTDMTDRTFMNVHKTEIHAKELKEVDGIYNSFEMFQFQPETTRYSSIKGDNNFFIWSEDICYILHQYGGRKTPLVKADFISQTLVKQGTYRLPYMRDIRLDDSDQALIACSSSVTTRQHVVDYIIVGKPAKLSTLASIAVHKMLLFLNEDEYARACQRLPPELRPFGKSF